jgi:hypothetical protein
MFEANVNAVGVAAKSFEGAALHMMQKILKLHPDFVEHFMEQQAQLTSKHPIIEGVSKQFTMAHADHSGSFTPGAGGQNSSAIFRS